MKLPFPAASFRRAIFRALSSEAIPLRPTKAKAKGPTPKFFVDSKRIRAVGGNGGDGCISLLQLWSNENAGPDGGDGGNGGHVVIQASSNIRDLNQLDSVIKADEGERGYNKDCHGKNASHKILTVPIGTIVKSPSGEVLGDLDNEGTMFVLARGGAGGHGNHYFTSDVEQCPLVAEYGGKGEDMAYLIEVKSMAHFGLVGLPNAGKSTLLQAISRARPKVAPYPFTTLKPHLGMVQFSDFEQIAVADLPGLIEGSHKNRGLGISFLKHVERCSCLLLVVDLSGDPQNDLSILRKEIELFNPELASRQQLVVGNKLDVTGAEDALNALVDSERESTVIGVSAKFGTNLTRLLFQMREIFDSNDGSLTPLSRTSIDMYDGCTLDRCPALARAPIALSFDIVRNYIPECVYKSSQHLRLFLQHLALVIFLAASASLSVLRQ